MEQIFLIQMNCGRIASRIHVDSCDSNELTISSSYEELLFSDLQEILLKGKTLHDYYDMVFTTAGTSYKGLDKLIYVNAIKALQIIIESKKKHLRRCTNQNDAIVFLHQDIKFSPNMIQNLLRLFDVKLSIPNILETSYKAFAERPQPKWLQGIGSG